MNTNQSDTPRTDAAIDAMRREVRGFSEFVDLARTLERELMAAHQLACKAGLERDDARAENTRIREEVALRTREIDNWREIHENTLRELYGAQIEAGHYAAANALSCRTLGCDAHMLDIEVAAMKADNARLRDDLQIALAEVQKAKSSHRIECEENERLRTDLQALRARIGGPNMSAECAWHDLIATHAEGGAK